MTRYETLRRPLALITSVLALTLPAAAAYGQAASPASAASAPAPAVRQEMVGPLTAAQQAIAAKQYDEAERQLQLAEAVGDASPYERFVIGRLRIIVRAGLRDAAGLVKAIEATLATDLAEPALRLELLAQAANATYSVKDHEATVRWSREYVAAGGTDQNALLRLAQSHHLLGQYAEAAKVLDDVARRQRDAGQTPSEAQLRLEAINLAKLGDDPGYGRVLERLTAMYPRPERWAELLSRLAKRPGFDNRLRLDVLRLGLAKQAWADGAIYAELAQGALAAGFPAEAVQALEAAQQAGLMGDGPVAAERTALLQRARAAAQSDRIEPDKAAAPGRNARAVFASGYAAYTAGRAADGLALMEQAVNQGLTQRADDARLQLGAAYAKAGDMAKARQWLGPLAQQDRTDGLADLARLWLLQPGS